MRVDPLATGELVEQSAIKAARGPVIDVLDDGVVTQSSIAQPGGQAFVATVGYLAIDEQTKPVGVGEGCAFTGGFEFGESLGHAGKARVESADRASDGSAMSILLNGLVVVAGAADIGVKDRDAVGWRPVCGLAIELVVEDRAHRAVGQRADLDGASGGRFEAVGTERPYQADNAQAGTEALFGMCGRRSRISSHNAAVAGPMAVASWRIRSTVQSA